MLDRRGVVSAADVVRALRDTLNDADAPANRPDMTFLEGLANEIDDWTRGVVKPALQ